MPHLDAIVHFLALRQVHAECSADNACQTHGQQRHSAGRCAAFSTACSLTPPSARNCAVTSFHRLFWHSVKSADQGPQSGE